MRYEEHEVYHIYNRGNNRQRIFFDDADYLLFLSKIREQIRPHCAILTWCLMPNHFHLMVQANEASCKLRRSFGGEKPMQVLAYRIGILLSSYSQQINRRMKTTGSLFQQKTKAISITEAMQKALFTGTRSQYIINEMHYHHQNPLRAKMVERMEDWPYSSFKDYAGLRNGTLCEKELLMILTDYNLTSFYADSYNALNRK